MGRRQGNECYGDSSGRGRGVGRSGAQLALRQHPVASRRELRAQDELALETARLETAVCLGDLMEGDLLGHWLQSRANVLTAASVVLPTARARGN